MLEPSWEAWHRSLWSNVPMCQSSGSVRSQLADHQGILPKALLEAPTLTRHSHIFHSKLQPGCVPHFLFSSITKPAAWKSEIWSVNTQGNQPWGTGSGDVHGGASRTTTAQADGVSPIGPHSGISWSPTLQAQCWISNLGLTRQSEKGAWAAWTLWLWCFCFESLVWFLILFLDKYIFNRKHTRDKKSTQKHIVCNEKDFILPLSFSPAPETTSFFYSAEDILAYITRGIYF